MVPVAHARSLAARVPGSELLVLEDGRPFQLVHALARDPGAGGGVSPVKLGIA